MINKNQYTVDSDKKVLHKIGKHWAVASTLMLGLAGGAIAAGTVNANADTTTNRPSNNSQTQTKATTSNQTVASNGVTVPSVKTQINNNLDKAYQANQSASNSGMASSKANVTKPSSVQSQATNMHRGLMLNATKPSNSSSVSSTSSKSSVASSGSTSSKPSFNSAYQNYMAKMSGADSKVASANNNNAKNNKTSHKKPLLLFSNDAQNKSSDGHWIYDNGKYISSMPSTDNISDGTYDGLTYKYDKTLQALEFTGGAINNSRISGFLNVQQFGGFIDFDDDANHTLVSVKFDNDIDTGNVTDMGSMFSSDSSLRSLNVSHFNTSNVTDMSFMFNDDSSLSSLDVSHFDTSNVTDMNAMFNEDSSLSSLDVSHFDTSKVTGMGSMFSDDGSLSSLDVSHFDTSKVTGMNAMFNEDSSLLSLDVSHFDTSKASDMSSMFSEDWSLSSLDVSHFDTSNVTNMDAMFYSDDSLKSLMLSSSFNTKNVTSMGGMFENNNALNKLTIQSSDTKLANSGSDDVRLHPMYKPLPEKDSKGNNYTLTTPNDFSKGNVGTFVSPENPKPTIDTDTITFVDNNKSIGTITPSGVKGNPVIINIPTGYHVTNPSSDQLTYDGQPHTVHVTGNTVKGTATIHLVYNAKDSDGNIHTYSQGVDNSKPNYDSSDVITEPIDTQVGDTVTFKPSQFNKPNYSTNDSDWTISFTPSDAPVAENDDFKQDHTFTYTGQEATHQEVRYIDITTGAQVATSGQFSGQYNNQSPIGPVVGTQGVNDIGVVGQNDVLEPSLGQGSINIFYYDVNTGAPEGQKTVQATIGTQDNLYQQIQQYAPKNYSVEDSNFSSGTTPKVTTVTKAPQNFYILIKQSSKSAPNVNTQGNIQLVYLNQSDNNKEISSKTISGDVGSSCDISQTASDNIPFKSSGMPYTVSKITDLQGHTVSNATFQNNPQTFNVIVSTLNLWNTGNNNQDNPSFLGLSKRALLTTNDNGNVYKILQVPDGYTLVNNENPFKLTDNGVYNVAVQSKTVNDKVQFINEQNGKPMGSPISSNGAFDTLINTSSIKAPNHYMIDNSNPENQKLMKNGKLNIIHDGTTHNVYIKQAPSFINVIEYIDNNGSDVGDTSAYGQEGTDVPDKVIEDDVPKDYQLSPNQTLPVQFTKDNVIPIAVQNSNGKGDMVVGTAYLTLLYKKGNHTDGRVLKLHINGNIGDSDIVINPQDYDKPGYQVSNGNAWHIPFDYNDVKHTTNDFSRYNVENTFTYQANPTDIKIQYLDTQTNQPVNNSDDLGQIAYDGDTIDLENANDSNGIVSVDGSNYRLNLPQGYHLAHANNYIKVTANGTYVKKVSNGLGGFRMLRMPLMKLTLGITPHFNRPNTKPTNASSSSVAPMKPSSASSVAPSSSNSASPSSASSVQPSSVSVASSSAVPSFNDSTTYHVSSDNSIHPIIPSDNIIVPNHNNNKPRKHSIHARNNNSGIVNDKTRNKPSRAKNKPNMIKHNRRVNRNMNRRSIKQSNKNESIRTIKINPKRPLHFASVKHSSHVHNSSIRPKLVSNQNMRLPQTGDNNISSITSVIMLLLGISLAGADMERKRSI